MAGNRGEGGRAPAGCPLLSPQQGAVKGRPPGTGRRIPASFFADILAFLGIICSFFLSFFFLANSLCQGILLHTLHSFS